VRKLIPASEPTKTELIREAQEFFSSLVSQLFEKEKVVPTCGRGCAACCYEPVYVERTEAGIAIHALKQLPHARQREIKHRLREVVEKFRASEVFKARMPRAVEYRKLGLACPFLDLKTRDCMIYNSRPFGCRAHFAVSPRVNCEDLTKHDDIMLVKPGPEVDLLMGKAMFDSGHGEMDHFVLLLAEELFGEQIESGSREIYGNTDDEAELWRRAMSALVIDEQAKAQVKEVLDFASKRENWRTFGEGAPPGERPGYVTQLTRFRCVYSVTIMNGLPFRHFSLSVPQNLPHPIVTFTIAKMFGFTGGEEQGTGEDATVVGPGPDWQMGPHQDERAIVIVQRLPEETSHAS
jgi:Fe-S-cluster containining protein